MVGMNSWSSVLNSKHLQLYFVEELTISDRENDMKSSWTLLQWFCTVLVAKLLCIQLFREAEQCKLNKPTRRLTTSDLALRDIATSLARSIVFACKKICDICEMILNEDSKQHYPSSLEKQQPVSDDE